MKSLRTACLVLLAGVAGWANAAEKTLYERLGGVHAIAAVCDSFVNRLAKNPTVLANPKVIDLISKTPPPALKFRLVEMLCAATGGPQKYLGKDMREAHRGLGISDGEWESAGADLKATLDEFKVPEREQGEVFQLMATTKKDVVEVPDSGKPRTMSAREMGKKGSLYERLGGVNAIAVVVDDFIDRLAQNPEVLANPANVKALTSGKVTAAGLKYLVTEQLCAAAGGPQKYSGRSMKESHKHLRISAKEWDSAAKDLIATLAKFKVPERERKEVLAIIGSTRKDIQTAP